MGKFKYIFLSAFLFLGILNDAFSAVQDNLKFAWITDVHFGITEYGGEILYPAKWLNN